MSEVGIADLMPPDPIGLGHPGDQLHTPAEVGVA